MKIRQQENTGFIMYRTLDRDTDSEVGQGTVNLMFSIGDNGWRVVGGGAMV